MKPPDRVAQREFRRAVLSGLSAPAKRIPCKYLYDARGSELFEQICTLPEYYVTRTEVALLERHAAEMARLAGPDCRIVEFGAGSSRKIRILLAAFDAAAYVPVDVSHEYQLNQAQALADDFPDLAVYPVCADFLNDFALPPAACDGRSVGFFPGSTIGNLRPDEAHAFLARTARLLAPDGLLLIGVDLKKDVDVLHAAYNDAQGVTARFSLNMLARINRELGGDIDLDGFVHRAEWDEDRGCIAIHLVSLRRQTLHIDGVAIVLAPGEAVHIEDSHKYTVADFHALAKRAGFVPEAVWTDGAFSIHCLRPAAG